MTINDAFYELQKAIENKNKKEIETSRRRVGILEKKLAKEEEGRLRAKKIIRENIGNGIDQKLYAQISKILDLSFHTK